MALSDMSTASDPLRARLAAIVTRSTPLHWPAPPADDAPILAAVDSVAVLELVVQVEEDLGVRLEDEDLASDVLATFGSLVALVSQRLPAARNPS
jgi:acyl carrier protein